jgi:alpha-ketoglutarate-dependent taurine dioxygenase
MRAKYPAVEHPVVRTHPETGRKLLFVNRFFVSHIKGLDTNESTALIDLLCREAEYPEYQCRFRWEDDSVVFWDNRAVQHYAVSDYWPEVRIVERASIIGDRPQ